MYADLNTISPFFSILAFHDSIDATFRVRAAKIEKPEYWRASMRPVRTPNAVFHWVSIISSSKSRSIVIERFLRQTYVNDYKPELKYGRNIRLLLQRYKFAQLHRPEEAIPYAYDKYEPGFIIALMLRITAAKKKMLNYSQAWGKFSVKSPQNLFKIITLITNFFADIPNCKSAYMYVPF